MQGSYGVSTTGYLEAVSATGAWVATQAEAEAGINNDQIMTPLRVKQALNANGRISSTLVSGTTTMDANWPDALRCTVNAPTWGKITLVHMITVAEDSSHHYRFTYSASNAGLYDLVFNADRSFNGRLNIPASTDCDNKSISTLYAEGKAFNFIGNSGEGSTGGLGHVITSGTLSVTANPSGIVSMTTAGTTWGYLGNNSSYLPNLSSNGISATNISITTINGTPISSFGNTASGTIISGTATMVPGWPDAIVCNFTTPNWGMRIIPLSYAPWNGNSRYIYRFTDGAGINTEFFGLLFNADGSFYSNDYQTSSGTQTSASSCSNKSISQLYAGGQAFNFIGNSGKGSTGGLGHVITSGTLSVTANPSGIVSLTTAGTTWGYLGSAVSFLPKLNTTAISASTISTINISASTINGVLVGSLGNGASPTNVPAFRVNKGGTDQTLPTSTYTKLTWNTKSIDTYNNFDLGSGRFTPTVAGNYLIHLAVGCNNATQAANACVASIIRNGIKVSQQVNRAAVFDVTANATVIVYLNGTTDYVEATAYNEAATASITGTTSYTYFEGSLLASGNGLVSGTGATALSGMSDVALTSPATGSVLTFNGSTWVNAPTGNSDRIISGTTSIVAETGGLIRINTSGVNTGYFDTIGRLVTPGVSSTGAISGTRGYLTRLDVMSPSNTTLQVLSTGSGVRGGMSSDIPSTGAFYMGSYSDVPLALGTHNAERMRISAAGQVGIGTFSPQAPLEVAGTTTARAIAQGSVGLGHVSETGWNGNGIIFTNSYEPSAITHRSIVQNGGKLHFGRHSASSHVTDMFIAETGRIGVGTNSPRAPLDSPQGGVFDQISVGACAFDSCLGENNIGYSYESIQLPGGTNLRLFFGSNQRFIFGNDGTPYKPNGGSWAALSDKRLKQVNGNYTLGLKQIAALNPVRYHYAKNNPFQQPSDKEYVGLLAQDVQPLFPEAVHKAEDGYYRLDTTSINFAVINAVKELKSENDDLKTALRRLRQDFEDYKDHRSKIVEVK